ncbi:antibiotic biosynthesis monooxygenase [Saccharibacter sp. 17.LH.SD]|uniref:putative quinol monooxygenase n=1 Tax=Saccharibacter sp. 17.LH.SD TaxID=2689393 RepID=UPI00136B12DA|nr:putative quinol monooxygenase [Saccharibacter sp. 17.LH.SD]MXV44949.1 antibiotic biosynthesis monooxygenase [Saccharibacter sp. 17.LH.SD]
MSQLVVIAEFETTSETFQPFLDVCRYDAERSVQDEEGCLDFVVLTPTTEPNVIVLYEVYTGEKAFEAHCQAPHFAIFSQALEKLSIKTRHVRQHSHQS